MTAVDPAVEAKFREFELQLAARDAAVDAKIDAERRERERLEDDVFGRKGRADDNGAIGELRDEVRAMKLWLQATFGSLLVAIIGAVVLVLLEAHR